MPEGLKPSVVDKRLMLPMDPIVSQHSVFDPPAAAQRRKQHSAPVKQRDKPLANLLSDH